MTLPKKNKVEKKEPRFCVVQIEEQLLLVLKKSKRNFYLLERLISNILSIHKFKILKKQKCLFHILHPISQ